MTDSDSDSPSTSPVRIPSVRGMLLARTHFEVLGFDGGSLRPRAVSLFFAFAVSTTAAAMPHME